jgi:methylenetetrahydrofolate dehydrogenase (NAD+)
VPTDASHNHHPHHQYEWEGSQVVADLAAQIRESVRSYTQQSRNIKLVGITTSGAKRGLVDEDAEAYSEHIATNFLEDGFSYDLWRVPADPQKVEDAIFRAEEILGVHGVLVFYPIFKKVHNIHKLSSFLDHTMNIEGTIGSLAPGQSTQMFSSAMDPTDWIGKRGPYKNKSTGVYYKTFDDYFRDMIPASLDVEGLCNNYNSRIMSKFTHLYVNRSDVASGDGEDDEFVIFPCTALAVAKILESCHWAYDAAAPAGQRLKGCVISIVNRSEIFGRPLAAMLANDGATVYSADIDSIVLFSEGGRTERCKASEMSLEDCVRQSSVVVTAVPNHKFHIPVEWLQEHSTVVNVAREKNVNEDDIRSTDTPGILYIPQVGQVTVALLEHNLVQLHRRYHSSS